MLQLPGLFLLPGPWGCNEAGWRPQPRRALTKYQGEIHGPKKSWILSSLGWITMALPANMHVIISGNCPKMHVLQVKESINDLRTVFFNLHFYCQVPNNIWTKVYHIPRCDFLLYFKNQPSKVTHKPFFFISQNKCSKKGEGNDYLWSFCSGDIDR